MCWALSAAKTQVNYTKYCAWMDPVQTQVEDWSCCSANMLLLWTWCCQIIYQINFSTNSFGQPWPQPSTPLGTFSRFGKYVICSSNLILMRLALLCWYIKPLCIFALHQRVPCVSALDVRGHDKMPISDELGMSTGWTAPALSVDCLHHPV